jgi:plasmid maintenance system antidote protein VapI
MTQDQEKNPEHSPLSLADHIREAFRESGLSVRRLAIIAEVDQSNLNKFMTGERDLKLDVADRLFRVLGLNVVRRKRKTSEKKNSLPKSDR